MSTAQKVGVHCHSNAETLSQERETVMSSPSGPQVNTGPMPQETPTWRQGMFRDSCVGAPLVRSQIMDKVATLESGAISSDNGSPCALAKSPRLFKNQQVKQMSWSYLQNQVQNIPSILTTAVGSLSSRSPHRI